ncbi:glycosyltransferase family 4 protein [Deinococcus multiflagellatus]|uniref:Glycosyltransferase family 4 protein n=1 Tax=Deinococcus multiflagellatus TaxID=1656887 RepID=A0ABW1ZMC5_9DEIO|nr:glycosyltransferase family 4 protein [Deinococcus multiflagellatus]MBZ9714123.1 glycosyltransferase family 4 protein [Deinococcus multiflagellatus]
MRLRVLSEYYGLHDTSTGKLLAELVQELLRQQPHLRVEVVTGARPYRVTANPQQPEPQLDRLQVTRLQRTAWRHKGLLGRLADDLHFTLSAFLSSLAGPKADFTLVVTNPPVLPLAALALSRLGRGRFVYLMHDIYPDIAVASGQLSARHPATRLFGLLQRRLLHGADRIVVLGTCMAAEVQRRYRAAAERIDVVPNWWSPQFLGTARPQPSGPLTLTYAGNLGRAQEFDTLLRGLPDQQVQLELIGEGERLSALREQVAAQGLTQVQFLPYMAEPALAHHFHSHTDVGLILLQPGVSGLAVPSKSYNLFAAGLPVLAVLSPDSEIGQLIRRHGNGVVVSPGDDAGFQAALRTLQDPVQRAQMATRAQALLPEYSLQAAAQRLWTTLDKEQP